MKFLHTAVGESDTPKIELTPLVDVMFSLLIFFLLTMSASDVREHVIPVALPQQDGEQAAPANAVHVVITESGAIYFEGKAVAGLAGLQTAIQKKLQPPGSGDVVIRAAKGGTVELLVGAMVVAQEVSGRPALIGVEERP